MVHSIGADDHGMFSVFEGCRLERNGSLEMHRWGGGAELAGGSCQVAVGYGVSAGYDVQAD